ncbi:cytochrome P450 [Aspergillus chevalieri]|uniref:Cytochrome P450 n=1 Tax=Aspergillus chevalieri TaxID=182096 RepID=A0A7R7VG90_ASPCH|nr:uncharacterized protein ACHE_11461S [Aspergillus chevalieri]BCR84059.1 hypothetical protein ACHE_11461S [Aspergillus chevalieri]
MCHLLLLSIGNAGAQYGIIQSCSPLLICKLGGYYLLGLYSSMLVYRGFFHRLCQFPGPFLARLSNFYLTRLSAKNLHLYEEVQALHREYGDIVRVGPSELSITHPDAVKAIYSNASPVTKGPWYTLLDPRVSLSFSRDKQVHARRRRVWDRGFSTKALHAYEPVVQMYSNQLANVIDRDLDQPIDITRWLSYYAFDVMGNLAFGKTFDMIRDGKESYFLRTIRTDMGVIGYLKHQPWLFPLFAKTPLVNANHLAFWKWIEDRMTERIESWKEGDRRDVFAWILDEYLKGPRTQQDTLNLHGDGYLIVVAGSDTTSATMTHLFFHLARNKKLTEELQRQLDALSNHNDDSLAELDLLDAIIHESLRLHPAVPSGVQRLTPAEGITVDPRAFDHPDEFIPKRWTTQPELVKDRSNFIPFLTGSYACVGRRLALMEIRRVTADLLSRFNISFAPGQSEKTFLDGKVDAFTLVAAPLWLEFSRRDKK